MSELEELRALRDAPSPWDDDRWLDEASAWIRDRARAAGIRTVETIVVQKMARWSALIRAETSAGRLYLKAVPMFARHEPALMRRLSSDHPRHVPAVLSIDADRRWILMREVQGRPLYDASGLGCWQRALESFARIQRHYASQVQDLFQIGCPDRRPARLARDLADMQELLLADDSGSGALSHDERERVKDAMPAWQSRCARSPIARFPDATLDHGDLHPYNVLVTGDNSVYLDWSSGAVGSPFFSPLILLGYAQQSHPELRRGYDSLRHAYLRPWMAVAPLAELIEAFEYYRPLAYLNYALCVARAPVDPDRDGHAAADKVRATIAFCLRASLAALA